MGNIMNTNVKDDDLDELDEIQESEKLISELKYFCENANEYGYKIKCNFRKLDFNFTQNDKIENDK